MEPMKPMKPLEPMKPMAAVEPWWPQDLGQPASSGSQNDLRYAFFPTKHRLLVEQSGDLKTFDSGEHDIRGVLQVCGDGKSVTFTGATGTINLADLKRI
jgi:hypothetical protein